VKPTNSMSTIHAYAAKAPKGPLQPFEFEPRKHQNVAKLKETFEMNKTTTEIRKVQVERFSLTSSKPFDQVVAALNSAVGHPSMDGFWKAVSEATTKSDMEKVIQSALAPSGFMEFARFDHGGVVHKGETGCHSKVFRFVIGNPLIMRQMAKHVPDAGSYAPVTVLVDERADGVHLSYDRMASFLAAYDNAEALKVARDLDGKVEALLTSAAG